jgi:hypothetical protein
MVGRSLRSAASRSHIAVFGSSRPSDRYSAIPSMAHSGNVLKPRLEAGDEPAMSYWNTCTSSWPSTWSLSA